MDNDAYYLQRLVDHVPSMMAYWGPDLRCRFANPAYRTWLGVDPGRVVGMHIRDLLGPDLFALNQAHIAGALAGQPQTFERIIPGPDGVQRHALTRYLPDIEDDVVKGFVAHVTEITELAREQALRAQLEQRAAQLNTLLTERSDMLDVLAHEVRQPLHNASAALQSAQAALAEVEEKVATPKLARAQSVMTQVMASLDNTLAAAALLTRASPIDMEDTDIDMLVALAITDMTPADRARIVVQRVTRMRTAVMDMSLMRLALRNLLSNALKYGRPDTPVVVRLQDSDDPLGLMIDVEDVGPCIAPGALPMLFERGARDRQHHGAPVGLGLGLHIVRRVMELHGGRVDLARNTPPGIVMRMLLTPATT